MQTPSPWLVGLLPWVIDLLFKTSFLNSFWGALLWGLILVVYFAGAHLKDPSLKKNLNGILLLLSILWLGGWVRTLIYPIENPLKASTSLYFLHGTFLVASAGMLLLVLSGALVGISIEKRFFARRDSKSAHRSAPSIEGVIKLCSWSLSLASRFWILGTVLAIMALAVQISHNHQSWTEVFSRWLTDPAVWGVLLLAAVLGFSPFYLHSDLKLRTLFRGYLILSLLTLVVVSAVIWAETSQTGHFQREFLH